MFSIFTIYLQYCMFTIDKKRVGEKTQLNVSYLSLTITQAALIFQILECHNKYKYILNTFYTMYILKFYIQKILYLY